MRDPIAEVSNSIQALKNFRSIDLYLCLCLWIDFPRKKKSLV